METWVESDFYSKPPQLRNAPETRQSSGRSRAIDIYLNQNLPLAARISHTESEKLATALELADNVNKPLLDSTVFIDNALISKGEQLTMNSLPCQV